MALSGILLAPGLATLWTAWKKFMAPIRPKPLPLLLTGAGMFAINLTCAFVLAGYRHHSGSLTKAASFPPGMMCLPMWRLSLTGY